MHELTRSIVVPAPPARVWALIGDFAALGDWVPGVPSPRIEEREDPNEPGAVRVFTVDGEDVAHERLLVHDAAHRFYTYTVLDLPLPITGYHATLAVRQHPGGSEVVWSATYEGADDVVPQVEAGIGDATFASGLTALKARLS
ncbi:SRPBCC family protein [Streptomyces sp. NPDC088348]|uniref:SRPBCC family protein n=1 Tax=Streptomyces sp. NPDC088348 TaxID=3365853 RepID=UPI00381B58C6